MSLIDAVRHYRNHPIHFVQDIIGVNPTPDQEKVLLSLTTSSQIAVKSGHGIGKTAVEAWAVLWFLSTHPFSKCPCTAPTQHQLEDVLWPEISVWLNRSKLKGVYEWTKTRLWMKGYSDSWFSVPRSCSKPENLQGFHGQSILFVIDEASGVPQDIMEVVEGTLTNAGAMLLMCGNPTQLSGTFFNAFHRDRKLYQTYTFSSENSPIVTAEYCKRVEDKYGKESDVYLVRVKGDFPKGTPDALISLADVEPAVERKVAEGGRITLGVDPARYGDDSSVIAIKEGLRLLPFVAFYGINTTRLTGEIVRIIKNYRKAGYEEIIQVRIDDTGIGGGVTDQLQEYETELNMEVIPVNFGSEATDPDYHLYNSQMWGEHKEALKTISVPDDPEYISQLTTRKYKLRPDGRIQIERKEDMKTRGLVSPDRAEAAMLTTCQPSTWGVAWV